MVLVGKGAFGGAAVGSIYIYNEKYFVPEESFIPAGEEQTHLNRYLAVKKEAFSELEQIKLSMQKTDPKKAEIFRAHQEIVEDIIINEEIPARILNEHWAGDWAIYLVYETVLGALRKTTDPLIAERAEDFDDVRALLLKLWYGKTTCGLSNLKEPCVIAARQLLPSDTANLDRSKVLAILTELGGATSHSAIIAKSYGIPAVLGIEGLMNFVSQGQLAAVDAEKGTVILDPDENLIKELHKKNSIFHNDRQDAEKYRDYQSHTACGVKIDIGLNISNLTEEEIIAESYTDFAGLFRTEFLFMGRNTLPTEEEQFTSYKKILECFGKKPVVLRTLDIGGDKKISSIKLDCEENPFLGNRGIRFCFSNPEIFKTQIRAALRASVFGNLWLMLPMVGSIEDIRKAKEYIISVREELNNKGLPYTDVKIGIMIEVPSIALVADLAVKEVDFASIGSNDLCQYLCAADRMNSAVEIYCSQYHPGLFRLMKEIIKTFSDAGKPISICGELGGDSLAVPVLIGLGMRKFSMSAASVALVKRTIASITLEKAEKLAEKTLELSTAEDIKQILSNFHN